MNIKQSWIESNDYLSCHSSFKSFVSFLMSPTYIQVLKEQRPEEFWTEITPYFCIVTVHETIWLGTVGHQLAKDSLSWINCKRRQRSKVSIMGELVPWGRGFKWFCLQWKAAAIYWPRTKNFFSAQSTNPNPQRLHCHCKQQLLLFSCSSFENQFTKFIFGCPTFAKMISVYFHDTMWGKGNNCTNVISENFNFTRSIYINLFTHNP